jgi:deoxyadenosine/deoxycytidine kinase
MEQRIIEIIGPPGVGKSTLYKSLRNTWTQESSWIYQEALLIPDKPNVLDFINWIEYHTKKILGKRFSKSIKADFGLRFASNNPDLANFFWSNLSDSRIFNNQEVDKRFRSAYYLFYDFCRYQAILDKDFDRPCIINEGLLQKSFFVNKDESMMCDLLNRYLSLLPLPRAVIFINTSNTDIILSRLQNRGKTLASHVGKSDLELIEDIKKWQQMLQLVVEKVTALNVAVLNIDAERPIKENVNHLNKILQSL